MAINEGVLSSGVLTAGSSTPGGVGTAVRLYGYVLSGGTAATSITFKDGGTGGTVKWQDSIKAQTAAGDATSPVLFPYPVVFSTDCYVTVAGTAGTAVMLYLPI